MIYILETHNDAAPEQRDQSSAAQHSTRQCTAQNAHEQRTQAARALEAVACLILLTRRFPTANHLVRESSLVALPTLGCVNI